MSKLGFLKSSLLPFLLMLLFVGPAAAEQTYVFSGRGTAHGVGLDMAGVKALAERGTGYQQILSTYYQGVSFAGGHEGEWLRVGILNSGEVQITADRTYTVFADDSQPGYQVGANVITRVTFAAGQYTTRVDGGPSWTASKHTWFSPDPGGGRLQLLNNGRRYRGLLEGRQSSTGKLWAINTIKVDDYVKGIAEEPNDWPTEGQRTLAVASRTYAVNKLLYSTRWDSENFDISATGGEQYYLGYDAERPNLGLATDHTRGQVLKYGEKVIVAAYHGNSGGHTESLENVWGGSPGDYPYLRGVPSPWTPVYRWGPVTFTKSQLQNIFNSRPESYVGTLYSIDLSDRTASGRVRKVRLSGSGGVKEVWGYSQFAAWLGLPSSLMDARVPTDNWDEEILLLNPNGKAANAKLIFTFPGQTRKQAVARMVPANGRVGVSVDNLTQAGPLAVRVESDEPLVAERTVYFNYNGEDGAHNSIGVTAPSRRWNFAEGATGSSFDTWLAVSNPQSERARVTAIFMPGKGRMVRKRLTVAPYSRGEIFVDAIPGLRSARTPAVVRADNPVVVDRATYFRRNGAAGGHSSAGSARLSRSWYFAEGYTGPGFETKLQVFNPTASTAGVAVTLSTNKGRQVVRRFVVRPRSRRTLLLNRWLANQEFGIKIRADRAVVAERTIYFTYNGKAGASSSLGSPVRAKTWYFAEGSTKSGFEEFLTILNTNSTPANIDVRYFFEGGGSITRAYAVPRKSRYTIAVANEVGNGRSVGASLVSNIPIAAERVVYFTYNKGSAVWSGGHASIGAVSPSRTWYFAEGVTQ